VCLLFYLEQVAQAEGLLRQLRSLIAQATVQLTSKRGATTFDGHHPRTQGPWRIVPHVLLMPTGKLRDPVTFVVLVKAGDGLEHVGLVTSDS
jgi:hypothetical protein